MDLGPAWADLGLWGVFLASFLAATLLPLSSEALVLGMALAGWPAPDLLLAAGLGNWAGGMSTYGLGWWGRGVWERRSASAGLHARRVEGWVARWGAWTALLCWMPVVGDLLAVVLGAWRVPALPVAFLMGVGKVARYAVLLGLVAWW